MSNNCLLFFNARRRKIFFARRFVIRTYFLFEMRAFHTIRFLYHRKLTCATYVIVNLFRWNDVSRTSRIFCPKIAIFSVLSIFKCNPGKTNNESLFSNYFLVIFIIYISMNSKRRRITVYGLVREPVTRTRAHFDNIWLEIATFSQL